jgi:hypothetical protein
MFWTEGDNHRDLLTPGTINFTGRFSQFQLMGNISSADPVEQMKPGLMCNEKQ